MLIGSFQLYHFCWHTWRNISILKNGTLNYQMMKRWSAELFSSLSLNNSFTADSNIYSWMYSYLKKQLSLKWSLVLFWTNHSGTHNSYGSKSHTKTYFFPKNVSFPVGNHFLLLCNIPRKVKYTNTPAANILKSDAGGQNLSLRDFFRGPDFLKWNRHWNYSPKVKQIQNKAQPCYLTF